MAIVDLTKQLAKEALLSATRDPAPAPAPPPEALWNSIFAQIQAMQKALKEDEELVVWFSCAGDKMRVFNLIVPSPRLIVLIGADSDRNPMRAISPVDALQLAMKVVKLPPGAKPTRVGLVPPKA
jgi:hypothetical protein